MRYHEMTFACWMRLERYHEMIECLRTMTCYPEMTMRYPSIVRHSMRPGQYHEIGCSRQSVLYLESTEY